MTVQIEINGQDLRPLLASPPKIKDNLNAVCRTLELKPYNDKDLKAKLGQPVTLYYNNDVWFFGFLQTRKFTSKGDAVFKAYDPLFFMKNNPDDYYFKNITASKAIEQMAEKVGIRIGDLESTGVTLSQLYYEGKDPDKIAIDLLARTYRENDKKFWFRYDPEKGLVLFERQVPTKIWAFQVGVNLEKAEYKDSIEKTITRVKLVNRETGKTVKKSDTTKVKQYGPRTHFEEVDRKAAQKMDRLAKDLLKEKAVVDKEQRITGINPGSMPQFYSANTIYVEEEKTGIIGAYHILNVNQTFASDNLIKLDMKIRRTLEVPEIQYTGATKEPETEDDEGVQQEYSEELQKAIDKYGL